MEIHLTPEQEATLAALAESQGEKSEDLAQRMLGTVLEKEQRTAEAIERARDQFARGEFYTHEEVGELIKSWASGKSAMLGK